VANNKSAKKRIQIAERNRLINKSYKSTVRTLTKKTLENCEKYKKNPNEDNKNLVKTSLNKAFSLIDKAIKKNVLHKNNGANKKSKINNFVKTGFSLTVLFVFITILVSIFTLNYYDKTLVEVDFLHGFAESFLTLSDFVILFGFIKLLNSLEVNNS